MWFGLLFLDLLVVACNFLFDLLGVALGGFVCVDISDFWWVLF